MQVWLLDRLVSPLPAFECTLRLQILTRRLSASSATMELESATSPVFLDLVVRQLDGFSRLLQRQLTSF